MVRFVRCCARLPRKEQTHEGIQEALHTSWSGLFDAVTGPLGERRLTKVCCDEERPP